MNTKSHSLSRLFIGKYNNLKFKMMGKKIILFVAICNLLLPLLGGAGVGFAQNIGINATGLAPAASAGLDVDFTNKGFLAPRVALTNVTTYAPVVGAAVTGLLVYSTAAPIGGIGVGYYYWDIANAKWQGFLTTTTPGDAWQTIGNAGLNGGNITTAGTNFMGTTDNQNIDFRTNNLVRMRVSNLGEFFVGTLNTVMAGDLMNSVANASFPWAINGYNTLATGSGIYANNSNAANNFSAIEGSQSGASAGGGGIYGIGNVLGTIGTANSTTVQAFGVQGDNDGVWAALGGWQSGPWTARKAYGVGTVSTIIDGLNEGEKVTMSAPESPDILFMDFGVGQLNNGITHISIDPIFTKNIHVDAEHPIKIFVQLEGECSGVYVTNKSATGFDVIELNGGTSNVSFSYSITANRANEVFTYSDGSTKVSDNINSRYHPVDMSFFKIQTSREGHKGRTLTKSRSLQMNNDGK